MVWGLGFRVEVGGCRVYDSIYILGLGHCGGLEEDLDMLSSCTCVLEFLLLI